MNEAVEVEPAHEKSTHKAETVQVFLEKHPNADTLSIAKVFDYTCVVRTSDFQNVKLAVYFPPETLVPVERDEFKFLAEKAKGGYARIRAKKIRGIQSFGLLIPATKMDQQVGDDMYAYYECQHFDAEIDDSVKGGNMSSDNEQAPKIPCLPGKYDIDSMRRYSECFIEGEPVRLSEKLHGHNSLYVWHDGRLWAKSRSYWKKPNDNCVWWMQVTNVPQIETFCKNNPGYFLYGEGIGKVKGFAYGQTKIGFRAFDIMNPAGQYVGVDEYDYLINKYEVPSVPVLANIPFNFEEVCKYVDGKTTMPNATHIREGLVARPWTERWDKRVGRVILKLVSIDYLEKN